MELPGGLFILLTALLTSPEGSVFCDQNLHITPQDPLVKLGSSLSLNCSTSCSPGEPTWIIMTDSTSATATDHEHYSTMELQHIKEDDTAFRCEVKCGRKSSRATVNLYPFAGPIISTDPAEPETGRPFQLKCKVSIAKNVSAELKLKRGGTVLDSELECVEDYKQLQHCEVSAEEISEASEAQYECEATLRVKSSELTESTALELKLREPAMSTSPPAPSTSPPAPSTSPPAPPAPSTSPPARSTAAVVTERVSVQPEGRNTQSSTKGEQSSNTVRVAGITCASLVTLAVLAISAVLIYRCKRHGVSPQEEAPLK